MERYRKLWFGVSYLYILYRGGSYCYPTYFYYSNCYLYDLKKIHKRNFLQCCLFFFQKVDENRKTVLYVDRYSVLKKNNKIFAFEMAIIISHLQMVIFCKLRKKALGPHLLENDNSISCRPQRWIDIWITYSNNSTY